MGVKLVLMTHGHAGEALVESSKMIIGYNINIDCLSLLPGMSMENLLNRAKTIVEENESTLFMVDLYGGTPSNVATALTGMYKARCVSGLNLGMLMETLIVIDANPNIDLDDLEVTALNAGKQSVKAYDYSSLER